MVQHVTIIQGHPDPTGRHFCNALADAYADGAQRGGHTVKRIDVAHLNFPILRSKEDFEQGAPPPDVKTAQESIRWANHLVVLYPLWLGTMPALLKAFIEQVFRYGFAISQDEPKKMPKKLLTGKSARIVITMGMPALLYRWYFGAHSLKSLERNILGLAGISPIRETLIGMVESADDAKRDKWLEKMGEFGCRGR